MNNSLQICAPEVIGPTFLSYNFQSHCILKRIGSTEKGFVVTGKHFSVLKCFTKPMSKSAVNKMQTSGIHSVLLVSSFSEIQSRRLKINCFWRPHNLQTVTTTVWKPRCLLKMFGLDYLSRGKNWNCTTTHLRRVSLQAENRNRLSRGWEGGGGTERDVVLSA